MAADQVPEDIRDFLYEHIESYEQLAVIRLLHAHPGRAWDLKTVALDTHLPAELASQALVELCERGLVQSTPGATSFTYAAKDADAQAVARIVSMYDEQPLEIMNAMNSNAIRRLRGSMMKSFANAFIVGKKKKDG